MPASHNPTIRAALATHDKEYVRIEGATHYYQNQPAQTRREPPVEPLAQSASSPLRRLQSNTASMHRCSLLNETLFRSLPHARVALDIWRR